MTSASSPAHIKHQKWLVDLTGTITAAGCEGRVIQWVQRWACARKGITLQADRFGNLHLSLDAAQGGASEGSMRTASSARESARRAKHADGTSSRRADTDATPIVVCAHMDHPAFVVQQVESPTRVVAHFRGGVAPSFFEQAPVAWAGQAIQHVGDQRAVRGTVVSFEPRTQERPDGVAVIEFDRKTQAVPGDVVTWDLPAAKIEKGMLHAWACDNLAGVAAALSALDVVRQRVARRSAATAAPNLRVVLTRSEEVGFVGAIGLCKAKLLPRRARVIVLETSRSYADSPIGGGPIVRVGDATSSFDPALTYAVGQLAQQLATRSQQASTLKPGPADLKFQYQRKLMPGGTCEASAYQAFGYAATCLCHALGNYHNQAEVPPAALEMISLDDFANLVRLLVATAFELDMNSQSGHPLRQRLDQIFKTRQVLLQ